VSTSEVSRHERLPPGHERDDTPPAPGDLEQVRSFLSLHDHTATSPDSLPPSPGSIGWWLRTQGLVPEGAELDRTDLRWAGDVLEAMRAKVLENMGAPRDDDALATLNAAGEAVGLTPCFGCTHGDAFHTSATGVRGAIARLLGVMFLAERDGSWARFKECSSPTCRAVFWDRSKNHSGRWCSMSQCGNRAKVRAYRERERTPAR